MMTRRHFLAVSLAASTLAGRTAADARRSLRPGFQLYSARHALAEDFSGTLARLAAMGYREVEFAGYHGQSPGMVARTLAEAGLVAPSAHVDPLLARDDPQRAIADALEAGHDWLVIAWIPAHLRTASDDWRSWADIMNTFAEQCAAAGLRFAYHNHDFEFRPPDGEPDAPLPFDLLLERCGPQVGFELDIYWYRLAGGDSAALLAAHPDRFPLCHIKDMDGRGRMVPVGEGLIDFQALLGAPAAASIRHAYVEHDNPDDPFAFARTSLATLSGWDFMR